MNWRIAHATGRKLLSLMSLLSLLRPIGAVNAVSARATLPSIQVDTLNGTIQGGRCNRTDVDYFFSVPYAKSPTGDLRFSPPSPHSGAYNGTLDGTVATPACPQFGTVFVESGPQNENWLVFDKKVFTSIRPNPVANIDYAACSSTYGDLLEQTPLQPSP
jgi:hypothetical protein